MNGITDDDSRTVSPLIIPRFDPERSANAEGAAEQKNDNDEKDEGDGEERNLIAKASPRTPSQREVDEHNAEGHVNFRSWCDHCVRVQAVNERHRKIKDEAEVARNLHRLYVYWRNLEGKEGEERKSEERRA